MAQWHKNYHLISNSFIHKIPSNLAAPSYSSYLEIPFHMTIFRFRRSSRRLYRHHRRRLQEKINFANPVQIGYGHWFHGNGPYKKACPRKKTEYEGDRTRKKAPLEEIHNFQDYQVLPVRRADETPEILLKFTNGSCIRAFPASSNLKLRWGGMVLIKMRRHPGGRRAKKKHSCRQSE